MTDVEHVVRDLERKAEISREIHIASSKKCKRWADLILLLTIILTMAITFLSLAVPFLISLDDNGKNIFGIVIALAGLAILFLSISDRIFGINERYAGHIQGTKLLTDFIRDCHQFRHVEIKKYGEEKKLMKLDSLQNSYSQIQQLLPTTNISDSEFLKIKQQFYRKVDISRKLDEDHNLDIDQAMKMHEMTENLKK
ncbi:hypothetical protein [Methanoregula sp. PtaB.Bin085]|uniref:hypothetical protein n=1 Tax=Methanoregula sp. PtaB.Bin085 TaxID=1811680 RepID=UPI0025F9CBA5|nr:hypothetical protein [Methanoregula sp. PtaB.Bin085]